MFAYVDFALTVTIFLYYRFLFRSRRAPRYKPSVPNEVWTDVFQCTSRHQLEAAQLACKKFDGILADRRHKIKDGFPRRRPRAAVNVGGVVQLCAVSGAKEVIVEERVRRRRGEDEAATAIAALEVAGRSLGRSHSVASLWLRWSLCVTEQFVDALLDAFPGLREISELKIDYPWNDQGLPLELLRRLRAQLPLLQHFGIENSPGDFDWSVAREDWFLSIPKFSLRFGEVYRPIGFPAEEDRIMQYLFDFSMLSESVSKYVDLSQVCVSDGLLRTLVERFLETENKLTVILECSDETPKPLRFIGPEFEETTIQWQTGTSFRYVHAGTRTTFLSDPWKFFITNVPDELLNKEGLVQDICHLRKVYREAFHRGEPTLRGTFEIEGL